MAFSQKKMSASITLAQGAQGGAAGGNASSGQSIAINAEQATATVPGLGQLQTLLRMSAHIDVYGAGESSGTMNLAIYGLPLQLMNQLSTIGTQTNLIDKNEITLSAGDETTGMHVVFSGLINDAFVDANAMPQVCFRIHAVPGGYYYAVKPTQPVSLKGSQDVAQMMKTIAGQMGLQFENNGVNVKLMNPYYSGSPWSQAVDIAQDANIEWVVDRGTLAIMPTGTPRQGASPLIAPPRMVGYPNFKQNVVIAKALWGPDILVCGQVTIKSSITPANGTWQSFHLVHDLDCAMPHGKWFTTMECVKPAVTGPP